MAAIDYGTMVFLNGRRIYANQLYPDVMFADLKIVCYKRNCEISLGDELVLDLHGIYECKPGSTVFDFCGHRISAHYNIGGKYMVHVKEITPGVQRLKASHNGMHLTILYGYGIDNNPKVWHDLKVRYLGKYRARIVDKAIAKASIPSLWRHAEWCCGLKCEARTNEKNQGESE